MCQSTRPWRYNDEGEGLVLFTIEWKDINSPGKKEFKSPQIEKKKKKTEVFFDPTTTTCSLTCSACLDINRIPTFG